MLCPFWPQSSAVWYMHVPWLIIDLCCVLDYGSVEKWCEKEGNLAEIILLLFSVGVVGGINVELVP